MNVVLFLYTIALILVCFAAAMWSLAAYAVSHRRSLIPQASFFVFYIVEITSILCVEFVNQNLPTDPSTYYEITVPVLRIVTISGIMYSLWIMLLDILNIHDKRVQGLPPVLFALLSALVVWAMPYGPLRQWLFYTLRQAFIGFGLLFAYVQWHRSPDAPYKERLSKHRKRYLLLWALLVGILVEDWWVILVSPIPSANSGWLTLYLSERNFSENIMMLFVAYHVIRGSLDTLALRFFAPPVAQERSDLARHIEDLLPAFAQAHGLSPREREVLPLVVEGKDNRAIAQELFLSEGTIKTHVHNIMVKTGTKNREELKQSFWAS